MLFTRSISLSSLFSLCVARTKPRLKRQRKEKKTVRIFLAMPPSLISHIVLLDCASGVDARMVCVGESINNKSEWAIPTECFEFHTRCGRELNTWVVWPVLCQVLIRSAELQGESDSVIVELRQIISCAKCQRLSRRCLESGREWRRRQKIKWERRNVDVSDYLRRASRDFTTAWDLNNSPSRTIIIIVVWIH